MKFIPLLLIFLVSFHSLAQETVSDEVEVFVHNESIDENSIKIQDVKKLVQDIGTDNTCLDEYLKRRKNLIIWVSASPLTVVAGTYGAAIAMGYAGAGVAALIGADALGGVVLGIGFGGLGAAFGTVSDAASSAFKLAEIDRLTKALAEQHLGMDGENSNKIYAKYLKNNETPLEQSVFFEKLIELDKNGKLCDGSMLKKPRFGTGAALRYKLARVKHLKIHL
jgi:hypothetical protein